MSSSPFVRKFTITKQSGPVYINSYALKGIGVQYRNPSANLGPVSLPTGWVPPRLVDSYSVDLSLEHSILEQAQARRQAIVGEVPDPNSSLRAHTLNPVPLIPYQSSGILTPVPVSFEIGGNAAATNGNGVSDPLVKPLGEMSIREFEGDASDPFERISLQAIDDFSELQSVLQPELTNSAPQSQPSTTNSSYVPNTTMSPPYPSSFPQPPAYTTSTVTQRIAPQPSLPARPPPPGGVGVLVNFDRPSNQTLQQTTPVPIPSSTSPTPPQGPLPTRSGPPPVLPKPRVRFSADSTPSASTHLSTSPGGGIIPTSTTTASTTTSQPPAILPPPYTESPTAPSYTDTTPPYPQEQDLYITTPSSAYISSSPSPPPVPAQFALPDIQSSLSVKEREGVSSICGMGFPMARVARAYKRLDGDNQAVLDFLFLVGELEEKGFNGDSAEAALLTHDKDKAKSLEYLNQVAQYKEMWPEESIHNAYQESDKDWEKTVDILTR